jgi:SP family myo-inositol transporter-like MFS transporter 13
MYFSPQLLELAGFRDKRTALLAALLPAGVNAAGTALGIHQVDRAGRRRLLLASLAATICALCALGGAFYIADRSSPHVAAAGGTCAAPGPPPSSCALCLHSG